MQPTQLATTDLNVLAKSIGLKEKPEWPHSLFGNDFSPRGHSKVYEIMGMPVVFSKLIYKTGDGHLTGYLKLPEDTTKNIGNMKTQGFGYYDGVVGVVGVDSGHNWNADQTIEEQFKDIVNQIKNTINKLGLGSTRRRYQMPSKLSSTLDIIADRLEAMGLIKEAYDIDKISDEIDSTNVLKQDIYSILKKHNVGITHDGSEDADEDVIVKVINDISKIPGIKMNSTKLLDDILYMQKKVTLSRDNDTVTLSASSDCPDYDSYNQTRRAYLGIE